MTKQILDEISIDNITDDDISRISNETGVEEDIIQNSIDTKKADEEYEKYKSKKETSNSEETRNKKTAIKNFGMFVAKSFIRTPDISTVGNVKNVQSTDEGEIKISMISECHLIQSERDEGIDKRVKEERTLNLEEDIDKIDYILEFAGVNKPSELVNKNIPIVWTYDTEADCRRLYIRNPGTILHKIEDSILSFLNKTNCIERVSYTFEDVTGEFFVNRNCFLIITIFFGLLRGIDTILYNQIEAISLLLASLTMISAIIYLLLVGRGLAIGLTDYISNKPEDRTYIKNIINN